MSKKLIVFIVAIIILVAIIGYFLIVGTNRPEPEPSVLQIGAVVGVDIQSPHPYPNGSPNEKRSLVWSDTLSHPGATSLRLHFDRFEIKYGKITAPAVFETVDYGPCEQNLESESPIEQQSGEIFVGEQVIPKLCGLIEKKKEYTPQEIFDNNWINGDFLLVKDEGENILEILASSPFSLQNQYDFWSHTYSGVDTITLELYADSTNNDFGISIDKYSRGFTEEEREQTKQERLNQYK